MNENNIKIIDENVNNIKISYYGAIPLKVGNEEIVSLTGSATIVEIGGRKILVDFGMFQGGEGSEFFNKENLGFLKDIDAVIITHAHIDHIGRLPLLYKNGFKGNIYMTSATKDLGKEMLLDSIKVQQNDQEGKDRINKKLVERFNKALKIKGEFDKLESNNLSREDRQKIRSSLNRSFGEDYNKEEELNKINTYLDFYGIESKYDVDEVLKTIGELPYNEEDIKGVLALIKIVEYGNEKIIFSKFKNLQNHNHEEQQFVEELVYRVKEGKGERIIVDNRSDKRFLRNKWKEKLDLDIQKSINKNEEFIKAKIDLLKKELESDFTFVEKYSFLDTAHDRNKIEMRSYARRREKLMKKLKNYGISDRDSIKKALSYKNIVEKYYIGVSYNSSDIDKASGLIDISQGKGVKNNRELISMSFRDAAHIVGSASLTLTEYSEVQKNIETTQKEINGKLINILDISGEFMSISLSGDLGRVKGNRLGKAELPEKKLSYLQIESTYGGREHRARKESVAELMSSINESKGDTLISVFSQQRTQEIMLTLAEEFESGFSDVDDYEVIIDGPLSEKVTNIYFKHAGKVYNLLKESEQIKVFGRVIFRFLKEGEWEDIYNKDNNKKEVVIEEIDSDNVTKLIKSKHNKQLNGLMEIVGGDKYNKIYEDIIEKLVNNIGEEIDKKKGFNYNDLTKYIRKILTEKGIGIEGINDNNKLFVKLIGSYLDEDEQIRFSFIKAERKRIILSSSGMMNGGAIMNHLPNILADKDATLLAPGYLSPGTIGNTIVVEQNPEVVIKGEKVKINCNTKFIDGFSSHISHSEILNYIKDCIINDKFEQNATISFTHGSSLGQELLKTDLANILKGHDREDINILIPELFSGYDVSNRKILELDVDKEPLIEIKKGTKSSFKTPEVLFKNTKNNKQKANSKKINELSKVEELKSKVTKEYNKGRDIQIEELVGDMLEQALESYLSKLLPKNIEDIGDLEQLLSNISNLSQRHKNLLYNSVNAKKQKLSDIKKHIKSLNTSNDKLKEEYNVLQDFFDSGREQIIKDLNKLYLDLDGCKDSLVALLESTNQENLRKESEIKKILKEISKLKKTIFSFEAILGKKYHKVITSEITLLEKSILDIESKIIENETKLSNFTDTNKRTKANKSKFIEKEKIIVELKRKLSEFIKLKEGIYSLYGNSENNFGSNFYRLLQYRALKNKFNKLRQSLFSGDKRKVNRAKNSFRGIYTKRKEKIKAELTILKSDLESDLILNFEKYTKRFNNVDTLNVLFKGNNLNYDKLIKLLDEDNFDESTTDFIKKKLSKLSDKGSDDKGNKKIIQSISKFLKEKNKENSDLGVNLKLSLEDLELKLLKYFSVIFEDSYYNDIVLKKFNIYSYLSCKGSLKYFIINKFDITKLVGSEKIVKSYQATEDCLLNIQKNLDLILKTSNASNIKESELSTALYEVEQTISAIEYILNG